MGIRNIKIVKDKTLFSTGFTDLWLWVYNNDTGTMMDGIKVGRYRTLEDEWQIDFTLIDASSHIANVLRMTGCEVEVQDRIEVKDLREEVTLN